MSISELRDRLDETGAELSEQRRPRGERGSSARAPSLNSSDQKFYCRLLTPTMFSHFPHASEGNVASGCAMTVPTVSALVAALAALLAQDGPARDDAVEFLLDRMTTEGSRSVLLDAAPLAPVVVDLDALPAESRIVDGARRIHRLDLPVRRDGSGRPVAARCTTADGSEAEGVRLLLIASRQELTLARLPGFAGMKRHAIAEGEPGVHVEGPIDAPVT